MYYLMTMQDITAWPLFSVKFLEKWEARYSIYTGKLVAMEFVYKI